MQTKDFHYDLPEHLIAQHPTTERGASRLLVARSGVNELEDTKISQLGEVFSRFFGNSEGTLSPLVIFNQSKVYPARIPILRSSGGRGEVFVLGWTNNDDGLELDVLLRPQKKMKVGDSLFGGWGSEEGDLGTSLTPLFEVTRIGQEYSRVRSLQPVSEILARFGQMPLPPYIRRLEGVSTADDLNRYQNVYAKETGSAAAPTAGLHFTTEHIEKLQRNKEAEFVPLTLHVGLGTFRPVQTEKIADHHMHSETYSVPRDTLLKIFRAMEDRRPIVYIGTTSFRAMESFLLEALSATQRSQEREKPFQWNAFKALALEEADCQKDTSLFVYPGKDGFLTYASLLGQAILTNFHQPESTLLMLISALVGMEKTQRIYTHAVAGGYRFLSYGDASCLGFAEPPRLPSLFF